MANLSIDGDGDGDDNDDDDDDDVDDNDVDDGMIISIDGDDNDVKGEEEKRSEETLAAFRSYLPTLLARFALIIVIITDYIPIVLPIIIDDHFREIFLIAISILFCKCTQPSFSSRFQVSGEFI